MQLEASIEKVTDRSKNVLKFDLIERSNLRMFSVTYW